MIRRSFWMEFILHRHGRIDIWIYSPVQDISQLKSAVFSSSEALWLTHVDRHFAGNVVAGASMAVTRYNGEAIDFSANLPFFSSLFALMTHPKIPASRWIVIWFCVTDHNDRLVDVRKRFTQLYVDFCSSQQYSTMGKKKRLCDSLFFIKHRTRAIQTGITKERNWLRHEKPLPVLVVLYSITRFRQFELKRNNKNAFTHQPSINNSEHSPGQRRRFIVTSCQLSAIR